ncbi:hypothetical protein X727_24565 [Mesorhizobium sp. L103C119B0]|nr:hypothetical protein X727_24565 [Mesorhizobium sp. L103C119B0]
MRAGMIGQFPTRFVSRPGFHCSVASRISAEMRVEQRGTQGAHAELRCDDGHQGLTMMAEGERPEIGIGAVLSSDRFV